MRVLIPLALMLLPSIFPPQDQSEPRPSSRESRRPAHDKPGRQEGRIAPAIKLKTVDGKREIDVASFRGKRPVIVFFGSYT